jgi:hypothetical protein
MSDHAGVICHFFGPNTDPDRYIDVDLAMPPLVIVMMNCCFLLKSNIP